MEKNRSSELEALFQSYRASSTNNGSREALRSTNEVRQFSQFAQKFSRDIASVSALIMRLTEISSRQSIFEDQSSETTTLTQMVKSSLQKLHKDLDTLEGLKSAAISSQKRTISSSREQYLSNSSHSAEKHNDTLVQGLKGKLAKTGQEFRIALEQQTQNMKSNSKRRNLFSSADRPQSLETALNQDLEQYQQQQVLQSGNLQFARRRTEDVMQIEAAVTEVNELFHDFTRLLREQEDVVVRIDANVDVAVQNVNAGSNELLRYLGYLNSNRSLIMKILVFLFFFLIFFGFVVVH